MPLRLVTPPTVEPLTITDVQAHIRVDDLSGEALAIGLFIQALRERAEAETHRALITQTWELSMDKFPIPQVFGYTGLAPIYPRHFRGEIELPKGQLQAITSITYIDVLGVQQILDPAAYTIDNAQEPALLVPAYGCAWPGCRGDINGVKIRYTAGYGATAATIPAAVRAWMLMNIASLYENRESTVVGPRIVMAELTTICDSLLMPFYLPVF